MPTVKLEKGKLVECPPPTTDDDEEDEAEEEPARKRRKTKKASSSKSATPQPSKSGPSASKASAAGKKTKKAASSSKANTATPEPSTSGSTTGDKAEKGASSDKAPAAPPQHSTSGSSTGDKGEKAAAATPQPSTSDHDEASAAKSSGDADATKGKTRPQPKRRTKKQAPPVVPPTAQGPTDGTSDAPPPPTSTPPSPATQPAPTDAERMEGVIEGAAALGITAPPAIDLFNGARPPQVPIDLASLPPVPQLKKIIPAFLFQNDGIEGFNPDEEHVVPEQAQPEPFMSTQPMHTGFPEIDGPLTQSAGEDSSMGTHLPCPSLLAADDRVEESDADYRPGDKNASAKATGQPSTDSSGKLSPRSARIATYNKAITLGLSPAQAEIRASMWHDLPSSSESTVTDRSISDMDTSTSSEDDAPQQPSKKALGKRRADAKRGPSPDSERRPSRTPINFGGIAAPEPAARQTRSKAGGAKAGGKGANVKKAGERPLPGKR